MSNPATAALIEAEAISAYLAAHKASRAAGHFGNASALGAAFQAALGNREIANRAVVTARAIITVAS